MSARSGFSALSAGCGMRSTTASRISCVPVPSFAEAKRISSAAKAEGVDELLRDALGLGAGEVDLVDHGDELQVGVERQVDVGEGLRLDALGGVDDEQGAFAGGEGARDLVAEVDVAGGIDEVELVGVAVLGREGHADGLGLDGDALLALQVHGVEHLGGHIALGDSARHLQEAVGEGGFAVVDVGDDAEVADSGWIHVGVRVATWCGGRWSPGTGGEGGAPERAIGYPGCSQAGKVAGIQ